MTSVGSDGNRTVRDGRGADATHPQPAARFHQAGDQAERRDARCAGPRRPRRCPGRTPPPTPSARASGASASGSRQSTLRISGGPCASQSAAGLAGVTIAHQIRPSAPVDRLSGMPGRLTTSGVTVPAFGPVSQYLDSRRPCVSANTSADAVGGRRDAVGEVQTRNTVSTVPSGSRRNRLPRARASRMRADVVRVGERAGRLGEIDCAVRLFR